MLLLCIVAPGQAGPPPTLPGFSPVRSAWQREYERRLYELPQPSSCDATLRELTRTPHVAGTPENARVADFIAGEYRKAGLEVETPTYDVLLSYPQDAHIEIVGSDVRLGRKEKKIDSDPDTDAGGVSIPWNAYAPSCDLEAEVVYANRGSASDYDQLARLGVDVRGKIVLTRYFGGYRGGKSLEAERRGVAALLVYSDPIDDGWFKGATYPDGPWGNNSHVQRGANVYDFIVPGDPLTPGWASTAGARRIAESESTILPKIPMMPLSARDAAEILSRLRGPAVPEGWQGVAWNDTYRVGAGPVRIRLRIQNTREVRTIRNVIATLRGTDEPDRVVLLSNHYDAWVYGAVDPSSGTASLLELGRALGELARQGWRPRRTIVLAAWDAEEYTLTGSTEWGEEHAEQLRNNAVVCINVDASASGPDFSASASPLLFKVLREVAADIDDPGTEGNTVADSWRARAGSSNVRSYTSDWDPSSDLPISILGSGSDYTVFFNHLGVPSVDMLFDGPYGVYHSSYDTYRWMATQGDPGFKYHAAMARLAGVLALRFANADVVPLDGAAYGHEIARYVSDLESLPTARPYLRELRALAARARRWAESARLTSTAISSRLAAGRLTPHQAAVANEWQMSLERALLDEAGIPDRPWFKHLVYAPLPSYAAETLPGIREALAAGKDPRNQIAVLAGRLDAAIVKARRLERLPSR
jgi:N-acetylated-alpha-linked acidic dipeptidase